MSKTYDFDIGRGLVMGIHEDDVDCTLSFIKPIDWLAPQKWFTKRHMLELIALTKERAAWNVWRIAED